MDALAQIWQRIEELKPGTDSNRLALGQCFHELRSLYSDRQADVRRTLGHGVFEDEIRKRGYKPRTVREWISDYEANLTGEFSSAAKRRATRRRLKALPGDPVSEFARLLPYKAAQSAFREAAKIYHPDHGGSKRKMQQLNAAWERAKAFYAPE
ncbi:MAG: hypothetical protein DMG96_23280 [Acidobacteria bacterium]|nr:MAG: hypothetical protein DMG96_23280 [Acidobacteriota bacterium]